MMSGIYAVAERKESVLGIFDRRPIPKTLPHHPGNIFTEGENVSIPVPANAGGAWNVFDIDGETVASGDSKKLELGKLKTGYYKVVWSNGAFVTAAVITPLSAPIPENSPLCAHAWLGGCYILGIIDSIDDAANIMALSGINSIRDSISWSWHLDANGNWTDTGARKSEAFKMSLDAARKHGLRLLMLVEPGVPKKYRLPSDWGVRTGFPADLRDYAKLAKRLVSAAGNGVDWEAWNEPEGIGGRLLGSEFTAAMKVFALAAHSVEPDVYVGMGRGKAGNPTLSEAMNKNGYLDAVDSYNYHCHSRANSDKFRRALDPYTGTRPVWATEFSYGSYKAKPGARELTDVGAREQARDIPKMLVRTVNGGNERIYYFMPLDFGETAGRKWGVLKKKSLQPRIGFLALAATGRLLAGAQSIGKLTGLPKDTEGWLVNAMPDGHPKSVAVLWQNSNGSIRWKPPVSVEAWDLWGHPLKLKEDGSLLIGADPVFCVFPQNELARWQYSSSVKRPVFKRPGPLCPVVADYRQPERLKSFDGDYFIFVQPEPELNIDVYNFSSKLLQGIWTVKAPEGYAADIVEQPGLIGPDGRKTLQVKLKPNKDLKAGTGSKSLWLYLTGDYGKEGKSKLAIRFVHCTPTASSRRIPIKGFTDPSKWHAYAAKGTRIKIVTEGIWTMLSVNNGPPPNKTIGTVWSAPVYRLGANELPPAKTFALSLIMRRFQAPEGTTFSINIIKNNGAAWRCNLPITAAVDSQDGMRLTLPLNWFHHIAHRAPDAGKELLPEDICGLEVVAIGKPHTETKIGITDLCWIAEK